MNMTTDKPSGLKLDLSGIVVTADPAKKPHKPAKTSNGSKKRPFKDIDPVRHCPPIRTPRVVGPDQQLRPYEQTLTDRLEKLQKELNTVNAKLEAEMKKNAALKQQIKALSGEEK